MIEGITWFGQSSIRIKRGGKIIYIDPWKVKKGEKADIIFITHEHFDHCSTEDIERLSDENTKIVAPASIADLFEGQVKEVKPGDKFQIGGIRIEVVPAYNLNKDFHPKASSWVGYLINIEGRRYYHAGDTDLIEEMDNLKVDVAFLPAGGTYTMTGQEAAQAATRIKAKLVIPIHWGDVIGSEEDAKTLAENFEGEVKILKRWKEY